MSIISIGTDNSTSEVTYSIIEKTYKSLLVTGMIGHSFAIISCILRQQKQNIFISFILLSIVQVSILAMNYVEFNKENSFLRIFFQIEKACSVYNVVYRSLLFLEPW